LLIDDFLLLIERRRTEVFNQQSEIINQQFPALFELKTSPAARGSPE